MLPSQCNTRGWGCGVRLPQCLRSAGVGQCYSYSFVHILFSNECVFNLEIQVQAKVKEGVLLAYPTTACFQQILFNNDPYTYTVNEEIGRVFLNLT